MTGYTLAKVKLLSGLATTSSNSQQSQRCPAGTFSLGAASACALCSPGTFSLAGAAVCSPCPAGTFGSRAGLNSSACSGACAPAAACPAGTATQPPALSSCTANDGRAIPSALGMLIWPAASPTNPQSKDLVIAPLAQCQTMTSAAACASAASMVGADGVQRFVVGTAAALNVEAAETLTCS